MSAIISFISLTLHPLWLSMFMFMFKYHLLGVAIANTVTQIINLCTVAYFIAYTTIIPEDTKLDLSMNIFASDYFSTYLLQGVRSFVYLLFQGFAYEFVILVSVFLSETDMAANIIYYNFSNMAFLIANGLGSAACSYVGNSVAKEKVDVAKRYLCIALLVAVVLSGVIVCLSFYFWDDIVFYYTEDKEILQKLGPLIMLFVVYYVLESLSAVTSGISEGLGRQRSISKMYFIVSYLIGIPFTLWVTFYAKYGLLGIWIGQTGTVLCLLIGYSLVLFCNDIEETAEEIKRKKLTSTVKQYSE